MQLQPALATGDQWLRQERLDWEPDQSSTAWAGKASHRLRGVALRRADLHTGRCFSCSRLFFLYSRARYAFFHQAKQPPQSRRWVGLGDLDLDMHLHIER